ncbi:hypothetical protein F5J12DRAFT_98805 [Pisolithus orientalis]|uniref:uncharacterized protein n=1 Tax=Pisolithus orientalis TaxID=936130 RepID=UPI002224BF49|nr:uncharacterized protein F5J12DRAFT_98805 [Pisolithus orientalis]KAI6006537.1 hypothetical protein F5J12DRAFT_98805 [Pisolithus orientalis]
MCCLVFPYLSIFSSFVTSFVVCSGTSKYMSGVIMWPPYYGTPSRGGRREPSTFEIVRGRPRQAMRQVKPKQSLASNTILVMPRLDL